MVLDSLAINLNLAAGHSEAIDIDYIKSLQCGVDCSRELTIAGQARKLRFERHNVRQ